MSGLILLFYSPVPYLHYSFYYGIIKTEEFIEKGVKKKLPVISTDKILDIALKTVEAAIDKKATNPVVLDLKGISIIADYFIIVTGHSLVQNRAIADAIQISLKEENLTMRREGYEDGSWILMDYSHIVIHIFQDSTRDYYDIEGLWSDAARVDLSDIPV